MSSVIIAATGEELAEIQKINDEDGSLGDESSSDQLSATTTTTTTTTKPSTINGTTNSTMATKSPEEVKLETKQRVSISELKFITNVIHNFCVAVICDCIIVFQNHDY